MYSIEDVTYQEETYQEVINDIIPLLELHWEEIALNKDKVKLNPDYGKYEELSDIGMIRNFTARDKDELVGYFVVVVTPHLHYKDHKYALNDVIYLKPDLRAMGVGKNLILFAEHSLKQSGVSVIMINTKIHQPFDALMENIEYNCIERVYAKYIGE